MRCSFAVLVISLIAGLGCLESSKVITTSPPPDAKLSQLDDRQAAQLCESLGYRALARTDDAKLQHAACLILAGLTAQLAGTNDPDFDARATCQQTYDDCIADKPQSSADTDVDAGASASQCSPQRFAGCDATVASLRECQDTSLDAFVGTLAPLTCADVITSADAGTPMTNPLDTPACQALYARCPALAEPPMPKRECSVAIRTAGAVDADVALDGDICDSKFGLTLEGDDWVELSVWLEDGAALHGVQATLVPHDAGYSEPHVEIGMVVSRSDGSAQWAAPRGCTGDLVTTACKNGSASGVRYRIENGTCDAELTTIMNSNPAPALAIESFSLSSACVVR